MIVLGLSGLPNSQRRLHETHPDIDARTARFARGTNSAAATSVDEVLSVVPDAFWEIDPLPVHRFRDGELEELRSQRVASSPGIPYPIGTHFPGSLFDDDEADSAATVQRCPS